MLELLIIEFKSDITIDIGFLYLWAFKFLSLCIIAYEVSNITRLDIASPSLCRKINELTNNRKLVTAR